MKELLKAILAYAEANRLAFVDGISGKFDEDVEFLNEAIDGYEDEFAELSAMADDDENREAFNKMLAEMKDDEPEKGKDDVDKDDDKMPKKKKKKAKCTGEADCTCDECSKAEAVSLKSVSSMLSEAGVADEKLETFSIALRTVIAEAAEKIAAKAEAELKTQYEEKAKDDADALDLKLENYVSKATAEIVEKYGKMKVDTERLAVLENVFNKVTDSLNDAVFEISADNSNTIAEMRSASDELKTVVENQSDEIHSLKNELMLEKVNAIRGRVLSGVKSADRTALTSMIEDIDFDNAEQFENKLEAIVNQFFSESNDSESENFIESAISGVDAGLLQKNENNDNEEPSTLLGDIAEVLNS